MSIWSSARLRRSRHRFRARTCWRSLAIVCAAGIAGPTGAAAAASAVPIEVQASPGQVAAAADALGASGLRVQRQEGRALQVVASPDRAPAIASLPGVAAAAPAGGSHADGEVTSQGINRTGATALRRLGRDGEGLVIAILDRGFGRRVARFQAADELPPAARLETRSFDVSNGLAGRNAYGNATNHGELVAQTVYDYAPRARYLFVNYDTRLDFLASVRWLTRRRPDIIVHSNSFIDGRFDGRGQEAAAVDAAAAAGILWFNSAGNYAQLHWTGSWTDADGNGEHEWPREDGLTVFRQAGQPLTYALSWTSAPGAPPTDVDIILEGLTATGWREVAASRARQSEGARDTELILGYRPPAQNFLRLRAVLVSGPPPAGPITLYTREISLSLIGGGSEGSQPSPGDAAGAISVGAVDWRGDIIKGYSAHGPTDDGRPKPDLVAPTNTAVAGPSGPRSVGGTSNAAPNAAGAAALLLAALRRQGLDPTPLDIRDLLRSMAFDLGAPGPDNVFGAGRVRVAVAPPRFVRLRPRPLSAIGDRAVLRFAVVKRVPLVRWGLSVDGEPVGGRRKPTRTAIGIDTRRLDDGWHTFTLSARDWAGNVAKRNWALRVDNTRPRVVVRRVVVGGRKGSRRVALRMSVRDVGATGRLAVRIVVRRGSRTVRVRRVRLGPGRLRSVSLGLLPAGRYRIDATVTDAAGNRATARRVALLTER